MALLADRPGPRPLASGQNGPSPIALGGTEGGAPTVLASDQDGPCSVAVDATAVTWMTNCNACILAECSKTWVKRLPLAGGEICSVDLGGAAWRFAVDGAQIFVARSLPGIVTGIDLITLRQ